MGQGEVTRTWAGSPQPHPRENPPCQIQARSRWERKEQELQTAASVALQLKPDLLNLPRHRPCQPLPCEAAERGCSSCLPCSISRAAAGEHGSPLKVKAAFCSAATAISTSWEAVCGFRAAAWSARADLLHPILALPGDVHAWVQERGAPGLLLMKAASSSVAQDPPAAPGPSLGGRWWVFFFFPGEVLSLPQDHSSALLVLTSLRQTSAPPSRFPCSSTAMFILEVGRGPSEGGSPFSTSKQRGFTLFHPKTKGVHPLPPPPKWRAQPCAWGRSLQPAPASDKNWF